jgi:curved DNA-binding protein CbpA
LSSRTEDRAISPPALDLDEDFRRELSDLARVLPTLNYYQVLGIQPGAPPEQIRDAFFQRSRRFHPDRFFRKNLGPYGSLINEVYKRVVAAHDVLRDPERRDGYDRALGLTAPAVSADAPVAGTAGVAADAAPAPPPAAPAAPPPPPAPAPISTARPGPSLRARAGLLSRERLLRGLQTEIERARAKAERHLSDALAHKERGNWVQAAALLRLAAALDPREPRYASELEEVLPRANRLRAADLQQQGEDRLRLGDERGALELLEECIDLEPTNAALAHQVARLVQQLDGDTRRAIEAARRAVELDEASLEYRRTLAQLYVAAGDRAAARREYQRIWQRDPMDLEAKAALEAL